MAKSHSYQIRWSQAAIQDLKSIISYIDRNHPGTAKKVGQTLRRKTVQLQDYPLRGRVVPELKEFGITMYHEIIYSPWRIVYRVSEMVVYIFAIFDSRRNAEDLLFNRLMDHSELT